MSLVGTILGNWENKSMEGKAGMKDDRCVSYWGACPDFRRNGC